MFEFQLNITTKRLIHVYTLEKESVQNMYSHLCLNKFLLRHFWRHKSIVLKFSVLFPDFRNIQWKISAANFLYIFINLKHPHVLGGVHLYGPARKVNVEWSDSNSYRVPYYHKNWKKYILRISLYMSADYIGRVDFWGRKSEFLDNRYRPFVIDIKADILW